MGISTMTVAFGGYWLGRAGFHPVNTLRDNLAFGALISACDPVATLATFTHLNMEARQPLLNVLLLGESMLNVAELIPLVFWQLFGAIFFGIGIAMILVFMMRM